MFRLPKVLGINKGCASIVYRKNRLVTNRRFSSEKVTVPLESKHGNIDITASEGDLQGKLAARKPLVKNFFVGVVDRELLSYPEVIPRDNMSNLQDQMLPLKNFFSNESYLSGERCTGTIDPKIMENVKQLGLYALNVPAEYNGKGYEWSASLIASTPETQCPSLALALLSHRTVVDFLREVGTNQQHQRFMGRLAEGKLVAAESLFEYEISEDELFNTKANYCPETGKWSLNGEKAYVVTGPLPEGAKHLLLVVAQTQQANINGQTGRNSTIFLVESDQAGVKIADRHQTFGCQDTHITSVKFEQVQLSEENIVGLVHEGNKYAELLMRSGRLRVSLFGMEIAKKMFNSLSDYSVESKQCGAYLKDMEMIRVHLSKAMCSIYAMESMTYFTAGLLDEFHEQDVSLEAAITKYFTLQQLYDLVKEGLNIIGAKSLHNGQFMEQNIRNAAQLYTQGESADTLNMFIALSGLQHAGQSMSTVIRKSRNPLFHPGYIFGKFFELSSIENPKTKMQLADNLHPSLAPAAQCIEHSVARLQMCVELMFTRYGNSVVERHSEMQRLAEISTLIYAMFTSAARASRSYCIGLPLSDHELLTATAICSHGSHTVKTLCTEIFNGHYVNNDGPLFRLASQVAKSKGYFATHPLSYNF